MIAGYKRFDTDLMQSAATRLISKSGAEGVQGVVVPERRLAIAVKVDDGQDRGYRQVIIELLRRYGALSDTEAAGLADRHGRTIKNHTGAEVGHLEVVV
jgi:L-asparaginase II